MHTNRLFRFLGLVVITDTCWEPGKKWRIYFLIDPYLHYTLVGDDYQWVKRYIAVLDLGKFWLSAMVFKEK